MCIIWFVLSRLCHAAFHGLMSFGPVYAMRRSTSTKVSGSAVSWRSTVVIATWVPCGSSQALRNQPASGHAASARTCCIGLGTHAGLVRCQHLSGIYGKLALNVASLTV